MTNQEILDYANENNIKLQDVINYFMDLVTEYNGLENLKQVFDEHTVKEIKILDEKLDKIWEF